ncbi:MAG: orotate phosphoribosyltransferase [Rickettsiales bacterium]|nr:orotate phosphoribosyltransferase [Rickettsiales bacterium]
MTLDEKIAFKSATILLEKKCINFSTEKHFKLTSGKESPVYCDCRRIISFPKERNSLINFGLKKISNSKSLKSINNIAGGESAGIPFASFISSKIKLPLCYIRKEKKKFGKTSQIEGLMDSKDNVLLVEDLITDGGSKLRFIEAIKKTGASVKAIFVIFNYGINNDYLEVNGRKIKLIALTTWKYVISVGLKKN